MPKLILRTASPALTEEEFRKVQKFYSDNRHGGNAIRDPEVLIKSISDQKAYLVEEADSNSIVAVSFCFSKADGDYTEFGGTRSILPGYGLQKLLSYARAMNEFMMDPPRHEAYTVIANWNDRSRHSILSVGFEQWDPDQSFMSSVTYNATDEKTFYRLPRKSLDKIKHKLLDIVDVGQVPGKGGLEMAEIDFRLRIIKEARLTRDFEF